MNNDQALAERFVKEEVKLIKRILINECELTFWQGVQSLPSVRLVVLSAGKQLIVPNENEDKFFEALKLLDVGFDDVDLFLDLFKKLNPNLVSVIKELPPYLKSIENEWHEPRVLSGGIEFFIENMTSGRIEKISVNNGSLVSSIDICAGTEFGLM